MAEPAGAVQADNQREFSPGLSEARRDIEQVIGPNDFPVGQFSLEAKRKRATRVFSDEIVTLLQSHGQFIGVGVGRDHPGVCGVEAPNAPGFKPRQRHVIQRLIGWPKGALHLRQRPEPFDQLVAPFVGQRGIPDNRTDNDR